MASKTCIFILCLITAFVSCNDSVYFHPEKKSFNDNWFFTRVDDYSPNEDFLNESHFSEWDSVRLPHTPKIEPLLVNDQWQGVSWYKKQFNLPDSYKNKKLFIEFEAAMNIAEVWVNGKKLIKHQGGYLPFVIDISNAVHFEKPNTISVKLNNYDNPVTGPKPLDKLDFNTYGGIYRNVCLIAKNPIYITHPILEDKVASGGIFVTYPEVSEAKAQINIQTHLKNDLATTEKITVKNRLYFKSKLIEETETSILEIPKNSDQEVSQNIVIKQPNLWSPEHPNLYTLNTQILKNNEVIDEEIQRIGIKTIKFVGQDFYLNGKKTFLRGVNRHQEYPYVGYALSDQANFRDAKKIKEAGFDYVRLSHYPQSPAFMDACDELGLVTINAILGWQYFSEDEAFQKHVFQTARDLIRRDRNRASVLAWEVSLNESWMPEHFIDSLNTIAKQEYPTNQCFTAGWQDYGYDIYLQARQHRLKHYDSTLTKPYNVSEYGDWEYYAMNAGLNQDAWGDLLQQERSSRQLRNAGETALLQQATNIQEAHNDNLQTPAFADGYWAMFDYNRGYADDLEASGIMDIFRIPKPSYYFFQSQRDHDHPFGKPMIYIANQWKTNSPLDVRIFSNCEEVELFLNGKSLGKQKPDENRISSHLKHPPFTFTISSFEKGKLTAQGFINGKRLATQTVHSPEEPKQIKLDVDLSNFELTNNDLVFVYAKILDENGTLLTNVEDKIEFKIEGDAELIGENPVKIDAGIASILLKTKNNINDLVLSVSSNILKLKPAKISLKELRLQKDVSTHSDKTQKVGSKKIIRGNSNKKQIALTFDDGPSQITKDILAILKAYNVKATFFWQGKNLKAHQAIINQALKDGHQIENHSWNHENGHAASNDDLWENQVHKTNLEFQKYGIPKPKYYRPPFGAITNQQINFLFNKNIKTALWSITTLDWDKSQNTEGKMFSKFKNELHKGAIVLLHDYDYGRPEAQLKDLKRMISYGQAMGYSFVSLDEVVDNNED